MTASRVAPLSSRKQNNKRKRNGEEETEEEVETENRQPSSSSSKQKKRNSFFCRSPEKIPKNYILPYQQQLKERKKKRFFQSGYRRVWNKKKEKKGQRVFYFILFFWSLRSETWSRAWRWRRRRRRKKRIRADADPVRVSRVRTVISTKPLPTVHTQLSLETVSDSVCAARRGGKQKRVRIGPCFVARRVDFFLQKAKRYNGWRPAIPTEKSRVFFGFFWGGLPRKVSPTNTTTMFSLFPCRFFCFFFNEMGGCNFCCGQLIMISSSPPKFFFWLSIPLLLVGHQWLLLLILPLFLKFCLSLSRHTPHKRVIPSMSTLEHRLIQSVFVCVCVLVWERNSFLRFLSFLSTFLLSHLRLLAPSCSSFFRLESEHLNRA